MTSVRRARAGALAASAALVLTTVAALPALPALAANPSTHVTGGAAAPTQWTADALPTVQTDGIVNAIEVSSTTGYAGGVFSNARPAGAAPGTQLTPRANLLAFDIETGVLREGFVADTNGKVTSIALSPDESTVYIAGTFDSVNGEYRLGFAALDASTGRVLPLTARLAKSAQAVVATDDTIWLGGELGSVQGQPRQGVAAIDARTGAVRPLSTTITGAVTVNALAVSPDGTRLAAGGQIQRVDDGTGRRTIAGLVLLDAVTGRVIDSPIYSQVPMGGGTYGGVTDLDGDERGFYASGFGWGTGELESVLAGGWDGSIRFVSDCHGDSTGVWSSGEEVHVTGHPYSCNTLGGWPEDNPREYHSLISFTNEARSTLIATPRIDYRSYAGLPAPQLTALLPRFVDGPSAGNSIWAIGGNDRYMVAGGDFPQVNSSRQQGLVRFARRGVTQAKEGPSWSDLSITATSRQPGQVQVLIGGTWDRDDETLTYRIRRDGTLIHQREVTSSNWAREDIGFLDHTEPGSVHNYSVEVSDRDGNIAYRRVDAVQVMAGTAVVGGESVASDYYAEVLEDGARYVWRPGQQGADQLTLAIGARVQDGLMAPSFSLNGGTEGYAYSPSTQRIPAPDTYSIEAWIKPEGLNIFGKTKGGPILGFGNQRLALSTRHDRWLYINNDGGMTLGSHPQSQYTLSTTKKVADNQWHHVVATSDGAGVRSIYIDGELAAQERQPTGGDTYEGYWRLGAEWVANWPNVDSWRVRHGMKGLVDTPAVYHKVLTAEDVARHYAIGRGEITREPQAADEPTGVVDTFERTEASGWGVAPEGGAWRTWGTTSVADSAGVLQLNPGTGPGVSSTLGQQDVVTETAISLDSLPTSTVHVTLGQRQGEGGRYAAKLTVATDGTVRVNLAVEENGAGSRVLGTVPVEGVRLGQGQALRLRLSTVQVDETTTALELSAWEDGAQAPATAQVTAQDSTPALQRAGTVGLETWYGGGATTPVRLSVLDWSSTSVE